MTFRCVSGRLHLVGSANMPPGRLAAVTAVDLLAELAKRTRPEHTAQLVAFTARCKDYAAKVANLEAAAAKPPIDWLYYQKHVDASKCDDMITRFKCAYESLDVPRPVDRHTDELDAQLDAAQVEVCRFKEASAVRVQVLCDEIARLHAQLPFDQMTLEDFCDAYPEHAPDFLNRPTFWPHTKEEQLSGGIEKPVNRELLLQADQAYLVQRWCGGLRVKLTQKSQTEPEAGVRVI